MDIAFDHQVFSWQEYGGISRYFCEVADHLARRDDCRVEVLAFVHCNQYLQARRPGSLRGWYVPPARLDYTLRRRVNERLTRLWLRARRPRIAHDTYYGAPQRPVPRGTARLLTVYDMLHERYPAEFPDADVVSAGKVAKVARADHVVCISEATRRDLVDMLGVPPERTSVVHLGTDAAQWARWSARPTVADRPYLLFVGQRAGYKNFDTLLRAVAASDRLRRDVRLVCFGGAPLSADEVAQARRLGLQDDQLERHGGDDVALARWYGGAAAFVYPSRHEGFGLPPLEAMACGCPVVCGEAGAVGEVVGDAAELCDTSDAAALAAALERVLLCTERAGALVAAGRERVRHFTWERCAAASFEVYRAIA
jgi:glycosyltransferase involved in cell wall biosynthesis